MTQEEISKLARTTEEKESDGSFWDMKGGSIRGEQPPRHHPETEEEMAAEGNKTRCKQKGTTPSEAKDGFGKASFSETRSTGTSDTKKKAQVFSLRKAGNTPRSAYNNRDVKTRRPDGQKFCQCGTNKFDSSFSLQGIHPTSTQQNGEPAACTRLTGPLIQARVRPSVSVQGHWSLVPPGPAEGVGWGCSMERGLGLPAPYTPSKATQSDEQAECAGGRGVGRI